MKWLLISLAIGLAASDKLDRTYLPPPGAQFAGGNLGDHDAPLKPPHHSHSGPGPVIGGHELSQPNFGINGQPVNFGDKIPTIPFNYYPEKLPTTTTSYAYSQTTTYPPAETYETTALPINPVTGLPIQQGQGIYPYGPSQGQQNIQNFPGYTQNQAPTYGSNIQPGYTPEGPTSSPLNFGSTGFDQTANQPLNQYPGQNVITPGGTTLMPGSVYASSGQNQEQLQYPGRQSNTKQQGLLPTGVPENQRFDQYPGQDVVNPGGTVQIPGANQGLIQYPGGQMITGQPGLTQLTTSPANPQTSGNEYSMNYDGSQGPLSQGTYTGQPIQNLGEPQPTQTSYQNQKPFNVGEIPSEYPTGNQNYRPAALLVSENVYHPGSSPSPVLSSYYNGVPSTTPVPGVPSSTSAYSSVGPVYRPERPQAAADRNAVILNYENIRTPNGYSYSFDTSNGIHADESGIVDNGTKAQGAYSYTGDDGKVYSVIYTADENGFQPRGDHLPTPPPIPEAIKRVIEQAARDKAAGIVDDGSYDEAKYGDIKYRGTANRRRPQNQAENRLGNKQFSETQNDVIKPIAGIKDVEYDEDMALDKFNNNIPITGTRKSSSGNSPARRPLDRKNNAQDEGTRFSGDGDSLIRDYYENGEPIVEDKTNQLNNYGTKQGSSGRRPMSNENNLEAGDQTDQNNLFESKNGGPSGSQPTSSDVKNIPKTKYPGSLVDVDAGDYSKTFDVTEGQDINSGSPNVSDGSGKNIDANIDSVTDVPVIGNKKQTLRQRIKGNRRPSNSYQNKKDRPRGDAFMQQSTETPSISDYIKNAANQPTTNQQLTQQDDTGYQYQQPSTTFEQNTFPTRFSSQEISSTMKPDQRRTEYVEGTTRRPFITPNVYNQNDETSQSTTRKPFMTVEVTRPTDNSYTDYDNSDDYATDPDNDDDRISSNRNPAEKNRLTSRPYQSTQTTSRPQYNIPGGQGTRVNQKGTVTPGRRTENTETPGYTYGPTTPMPSHNSRFGNTEISRKMTPQQRRPSTIVPSSTTAVGKPVSTQSSSGTNPSAYKYQTTGPGSKYSGANVGFGYPTTGSVPGYGSISTTPGVSTPQSYYTSTYRPQGYSSTTAAPPTSGYTNYMDKQGSEPSGVSGSLQPSQDQSFHTGYHYGPPKSDYSFTDSLNPDKFGIPGVSPTSPTGTYQTTYQQGPGGFSSTTLAPTTPGRQETFIPSQPGSTAPIGMYQGSYQNGPSTPDYATTIVSSTPGGRPGLEYPGSPGTQQTTGYEYGPSRPNYSTTNSPSTIGTTPGPYEPYGNGPSQGYSTTYRPGLQNTKDTFVGGPVVDGFGRPITTEQGGSHPGFAHPTQGSTGPTVGPNFGGTEQSTIYPGGYDQSRVVGEDFSGPKQPQRYDPKTGYHYK